MYSKLPLLLLAFSAVAYAAEPVGIALFSPGEVKIIAPNGVERTLKQGDPVFAGERVVTSSNALSQIRLLDGTRIGIRPETELKLGDPAPQVNTGPLADIDKLSLTRGTVRVISEENGRLPAKPLFLQTPTSQMRISKADTETVVIPIVPGGSQPEQQGSFHRLLNGKAEIVVDQSRTLTLKPLEVNFLPEFSKAPTILAALPAGTVTFSPRDTLLVDANRVAKREEIGVLPAKGPDLIRGPELVRGPEPIRVGGPLALGSQARGLDPKFSPTEQFKRVADDKIRFVINNKSLKDSMREKEQKAVECKIGLRGC